MAMAPFTLYKHTYKNSRGDGIQESERRRGGNAGRKLRQVFTPPQGPVTWSNVTTSWSPRGSMAMARMMVEFLLRFLKSQALWDTGSPVSMALGFGKEYFQALQAAKQWFRFKGGVRHRHWAM